MSAPSQTPVIPAATDLRAIEAALLATTGIAIEQHDTTVRGVRLHYLTCGEGEPLLLIHGRGGAGALFAPVLAALAAERRVITLDLPGWGLSDKPPFTGKTPHDALAVWREGVLGFLDDQGLGQIDIAGHSMGGFTALSLALEHPDRVKRLILIDPGGLGKRSQFDVRLYMTIAPERLHRWLGTGFTRFIMRKDGATPERLAGPEFAYYHALTTQSEIVPSGARAFSAWVNLTGVHLTLTERLRELQMPTLLLWGDRDFVAPYADALVAARYLQDGQLVTFNRCGHSPFSERPDAFAEVVLGWLNGYYVRSRV
jgi:4,5:9,10-diseco-3-hydroxy-5,9,17-trioxoandrosta-1(10),2-diene-4-oate hydrolase